MSRTYWLMLGLLALAAVLCLWGYFTGGPGPARPEAPTWRQEKARREAARRGETTRRLHGRPLRAEPDEEWTPPWERPAGPPQMPPEWRSNRGK